ncbi:transposase, partial [Enterococcus hirae]|nr:transposase [Enterococcus hirae]
RECMKSFQPNLHDLPEVLCVDEFRSVRSCAGKMSFIFLDGQTQKIIEVLENRRLSFLRDHFLHYSRKARQRVRYLVMDMNAPYAQLVKGIFPNAQIVIDRFHIVQQINRSFNQLRVQTMNRFKKADPKKYRQLKRFWKLLLKDSDGLDSSNYHYDRSFKQFITEQAIVDELLTYDE